MKKIIFIGFLLLGSFCFSQSVTEKYNSLSSRYEYYDSSGNMIGYKKYNNLSGQWEYYTTNNYRKQPYQYKDPQQLDISGLGNAATTLQNRYNNNGARVQNEVNKIIQRVYQFEISDQQKEEIVTRFKNTAVKSINSQSINYGSDAETNRVINYLYDSINKITHQVTD